MSALAAAHGDLDRVASEAEALAAALVEARAAVRAWEGAAAEATTRADRLADLLEEVASAAGADPSSLETALAAERARAARLEASVAALAIEAGRAGALTDGVAGAVLPALAEVEDRLGRVSFPRVKGGGGGDRAPPAGRAG